MASSGANSPPSVVPLIGLSTYAETARHGVWEEHAAFLPMSYVSSVIRSGGCPVLLPPSPVGSETVLAVLDGLIVTGGSDVDPGLYGAEAHVETEIPHADRDTWEVALCQGALSEHIPLLAICRGLQVLNVALGGTLHQHLPDVTGTDDHRMVIGQMSSTRISLNPDSACGSILGHEILGLCHHHQAIDRLGRGMQAVGFASDGTVEAVELVGQEFALGVQWHPEDSPEDDRLFRALIVAAAQSRAKRQR